MQKLSRWLGGIGTIILTAPTACLAAHQTAKFECKSEYALPDKQVNENFVVLLPLTDGAPNGDADGMLLLTSTTFVFEDTTATSLDASMAVQPASGTNLQSRAVLAYGDALYSVYVTSMQWKEDPKSFNMKLETIMDPPAEKVRKSWRGRCELVD